MFYKVLRPIRDKLRYSDDLEKILSSELYELIYRPLIDLLDPTMKENAKPSVLVTAFLSRVIYYKDGYAYGKFNASISKAIVNLGGKFNHTKKAFKISQGQFPPEVRDALARGSMVEQEAIDKMRKKAQELASQNILIPRVEDISKGTLADLHEQFTKLTPEDLQIPVEMNQEMEKKIRQDYTENIHLEINSLGQEAVERLRYRVEEAVGQGMRAKDLKGILESEYGVMSGRSKFIARQETSLFVSHYRQVRYKDAGLNEYMWSDSNDSRVRHDHRDLNGKIFRWDDPPITDKHTGARNNPGEDFGCRCLALAVMLQPGIDFKKGMETGNLLETSQHKALHAGGR